MGAPEALIWDCSPALSIAGTNSQADPVAELSLENNLVRHLCSILVC